MNVQIKSYIQSIHRVMFVECVK